MKDDPNIRQIGYISIPNLFYNWRRDGNPPRQVSLVHYEGGRQADGILNHVRRTRNVDMAVLATGYSQNFPFLDPSYPLPQHAKVRTIWKKDEPTIGFIGFVRPSLGESPSPKCTPNSDRFTGSVPPISEMQAQLWILNLLHRLPTSPVEGENYNLVDKSRHIQCCVNHEFYTYQLALDMDSVPGWSDIQEMGLKVALCYVLSANVNVKFRLVGPWKWNGAKKVMAEEIWETITRRPLISGKPIPQFRPRNRPLMLLPRTSFSICASIVSTCGWRSEDRFLRSQRLAVYRARVCTSRQHGIPLNDPEQGMTERG